MKVLYFASFRERLNCGEETINENEVAQLGSLEDLLHLLRERGSPWDVTLDPDSTLAAINQEMAPLNSSIAPDDEIAFFPPVTGG